MELTEAYRECERITWSQARNFAYGIRLLPAAKRQGLAAIYAFARRIDDIGDGTMPAGQKIAALEEARHAVLDLTRPGQDDPVLIALADVERTFPVPIQAFGELIDGCVADVRGTSYQTFEDLLYYCRCVAGSIGRLSLGIFGTRRAAGHAAELADSLGVALQLTNILRDIREDYQNGRVYLPAEDLSKFGVDLGGTAPPDPPDRADPSLRTPLGAADTFCPGPLGPPDRGEPSPRTPLGAADTFCPGPLGPPDRGDPSLRTPRGADTFPPAPLGPSGGGTSPPITPPPAGFTRLIEFEADRARDWYATGMGLLPMLDRRSAACTGAMAGIYRRLLDRIAAQPAAVLRGRMSLSAGEKAMVAVRALAGRAP